MSRHIFISLIIIAGCGSSQLPAVDENAAALQELLCPGGVESTGPNKCMTVPPVNKPAPGPNPVWDPFIVDGVKSKTEYFGAIDFPYAHPGLKLSGGHVLVNIDSNLKTLHVFLQNMPAIRTGEIRVYLDHSRFNTYADGDTTFNDMGWEDRAYAIDLNTGATRILRAVKSNGVITWQPVFNLCLPNQPCPPPETFQGVLGAVTAPNASGVVRFNAEYSISLPTLTSLPNGGPPGVGFGVAQWVPPALSATGVCGAGVGAFPEELAVAGTHVVQHGNTFVTEEIPACDPIDTKRNLFQSLVFGPPAGVPLKFMTWNIKRFTGFMHFVEGLGNSGAFDDSQVPPQLIGQFLAPFDVVALQEAWDDADVAQIVAAANSARAGMGMTPFFQIGPIDFPKGQGISFDSTTGGVYILSKFPAQTIDYHVYSACRGEDCLKAKGVLHARLNFSTTTVGGGSGGLVGVPAPSMKPDDFVDVYATHMQADELVCTNNDIADQVKEKALEGLICSALPEFWAACFIKEMLEATMFRCHDFADDATVRDLQVGELDTFVSATADRKRPAIIMGDFNQDHAFLNNDNTGALAPGGTYAKLLSSLQLGNVGSPSAVANPDDRLNPWPVGFGFPWQLDHSDIMRETFSDAFLTKLGRGTFIGASSADDPPPGMVQTQLGRLDYVLVRPGAQPGSAAFGDVAWMAGKPTNGSPVWASPWPLSAQPINTVGNRLSDHKPVVFSFQMVPFKPAPKFHPGWSHDVSWRVTSADDEGDDDCFGCGANDLYTIVKNRAVNVNNGVSSSTFTGATCEEGGDIVSASVNPGCVGTWAFHDTHDPDINATLGGGAQLWEEDDDPNSDDFLSSLWGAGTGPLLSINFPASRIEMRDFDTATTKPCLDFACATHWNDLAISDNGAYGFCTRTVAPFLCVELKITEIPPN